MIDSRISLYRINKLVFTVSSFFCGATEMLYVSTMIVNDHKDLQMFPPACFMYNITQENVSRNHT
jgi:hypothetical protein